MATKKTSSAQPHVAGRGRNSRSAAKPKRKPRQPTTSKRNIAARELDASAYKLRLSGQNYTQIGKALGVNRTTAYRAVKRVMDALVKETLEDAEKVRQMELDRLDQMLEVLLPRATRKRNPDMAAVDRVVRLMDRRSRYIGLDAPERSEVSHTVSLATLVADRRRKQTTNQGDPDE